MHYLLYLCLYLLSSVFSSLYAEEWTGSEIKRLQSFSLISHPPKINDPSNQYLNLPQAVALGQQLFNDTRLSSDQKVSCSRCHRQDLAFTDNKAVAIGIRSGLRNTPTLLSVSAHHWFFWDGRKDSLWSQSLGSIENPAEHNFSRVQMLHFISGNPQYRNQYLQVFNVKLPTHEELKDYPDKAGPNANLEQLIAWKKLSSDQRKVVNTVFSNIGKAIAAYVSTLQTKPGRFDYFVEELVNQQKSDLLSGSEQRGLKLFVSQQAGCSNCHWGSLFSNKEFHTIGTGIPACDNGRSEVIDAVQYDEFNCLGMFSDAQPEQCLELKYMNRNKHMLSGAYKTPSLRNLSKTAPYMHDGRFKTLKDVLTYYASIDKTKALELDLPVINLTKEDQADIVNFLLIL